MFISIFFGILIINIFLGIFILNKVIVKDKTFRCWYENNPHFRILAVMFWPIILYFHTKKLPRQGDIYLAEKLVFSSSFPFFKKIWIIYKFIDSEWIKISTEDNI